MKKLLAALVAALLVFAMLIPALAEGETVDETAEAVETAVEDAAGEAEAAVEAAEETAEEAVEEAEPQKTWAQTAFGKFAEINWYTYVIVAVLAMVGLGVLLGTRKTQPKWAWPVAFACFFLALAVALVSLFSGGIYDESGSMAGYIIAVAVILAVMVIFICSQRKDKWTARTISYAGICMAVAFVLSLIRLWRAPQGGSVTLAAMLPLILFAMAFGPSRGLVVGFAYGLLQLIQDPYVIHPLQLLVDYPMAFAALILCCCANLLGDKVSMRVKLALAVILGYLGRYIMAVISGVVFFADYAGEQNALIYSLGYNIAYTGPEAIVAAALVLIVPGFERLIAMMRGRTQK